MSGPGAAELTATAPAQLARVGGGAAPVHVMEERPFWLCPVEASYMGRQGAREGKEGVTLARWVPQRT